MAVTGKLGTSDSLLGNILLGDIVVDSLTTTDSPTLSESVSRTVGLLRTTTDSPTTSESVDRTGLFYRTTVDAPTISESATAVSVIGNVTFDAPTLSDAAVVVTIQPRTTTDDPTISEDATVVILVTRTTTDAPTLSESVAVVADFVRHPTDAPTLSESTDWVAILSRTATDAPTISESATASLTFIRTTTDAPTISESVIAHSDPSRNVTDISTISSAVVANKVVNRSISQTLTITQSNLVATPIQSVEQGLSISQSVEAVKDLSKSASNTLTFSQSADYFQFKPTDADNTLTITQDVDVVQTTGVGNELTITQDVAVQYDPHLDQQFHVLVPAQTVTIAAIFNRSIEHTVALAQSVGYLKIVEISVANNLTVLQSVIGGPLRNASNVLADLDHDVDVDVQRNKSVSQSLAVTQSVGLAMILNRSLVSELEFKQEHQKADGAGGFIQVPNVIVTQGGSTPIPGTPDGLPGPAPDIECCPIPSGSTVYQSATRAIVLPNPEYSDSEGNVAAVSIKRTITGQTYSYVKKSANRKLKYKFTINQRKAYELRRFLLDFLGDRINMTNWKGEMWTGFLLTDPAEIISTSRGGICNGDMYEVELEYQGVRVN